MNMKSIHHAAALSLLLAASSQAAPASFDFDYRIQDVFQQIQFNPYGGGPPENTHLVLNNNGHIAFQAYRYDPFGSSMTPNIYLNTSPNTFSTLVPGAIFRNEYPEVMTFDFNDSGTLAFSVMPPCCDESVGTRLYATTNGTSFKLLVGGKDLSAYSENNGSTRGFLFGRPSLNNSGQIAIGGGDPDYGIDPAIIVLQPFGGSPPVVQSGETARIVAGGIARTVASSAHLPFSRLNYPQINNNGQVAYNGIVDMYGESGGIYGVDGPGSFSIITTDSANDFFNCCGIIAPTFQFNDLGVAAYQRFTDPNYQQGRELVLSNGAVVAVQGDPSNPGSGGFGYLGVDYSLNNLNQVAFMASEFDSPTGEPDTLYFWDNGELVRVIGLGDDVAGVYFVRSISISPDSLNDLGQIAFVAHYENIFDPENSVTALVVALPGGEIVIPEPAGLAAFLGLSIAGLARRRTRASR